MIEKPKRPKQPNIQDRQPPRTLQELINRYDLDNTKIYDFLDGLVELLNTERKSIDTSINDLNNNKVNKSGDSMAGALLMQGNPIGFGNGGNIFFKEDGYGDKFRIIPDFGGSGSSNSINIQSTTGGAGTDPSTWQTLVSIHADTGEINILDTNISLTSYAVSGDVIAKKVGNLVIVDINCSKQGQMTDTWNDYAIAKLNGVTAKYKMTTTIVDQSTGLCADAYIDSNSDTIYINKRASSSINGEWLRGQLVFIVN